MNEPKGTYRIDDLNVVLIPAKLGNPNGMQITYEIANGQIRNLFVYAETGQVRIMQKTCSNRGLSTM